MPQQETLQGERKILTSIWILDVDHCCFYRPAIGETLEGGSAAEPLVLVKGG